MAPTTTSLTTVVPGSIAHTAKMQGITEAEAFLDATMIALVDVSSSMADRDARDGKSRYEVACAELATLQRSNPGKIAIVSFSSSPVFCAGGIPMFLGGGTDLAAGLKFVKAKGVDELSDMSVVVISDGQPDNRMEALDAARKFKCRIDTVFVGAETDGMARAFLRELATVRSGKAVTSAQASDLAKNIAPLLLTAGRA